MPLEIFNISRIIVLMEKKNGPDQVQSLPLGIVGKIKCLLFRAVFSPFLSRVFFSCRKSCPKVLKLCIQS